MIYETAYVLSTFLKIDQLKYELNFSIYISLIYRQT